MLLRFGGLRPTLTIPRFKDRPAVIEAFKSAAASMQREHHVALGHAVKIKSSTDLRASLGQRDLPDDAQGFPDHLLRTRWSSTAAWPCSPRCRTGHFGPRRHTQAVTYVSLGCINDDLLWYAGPRHPAVLRNPPDAFQLRLAKGSITWEAAG